MDNRGIAAMGIACDAVVIRPLTAAGIAGWPTRLVWIVVTAPTEGRHAFAFVTQRVGIAHQAGNFVGDVRRKAHGETSDG